MTDVLQELRQDIDAIDRALVGLLAKRLKIVDQVIAVKRENGIASVVPERIEAVVDHVRAFAADHGIPQHMVENLWRCLIAETIAYEEAALTGAGRAVWPKAG